MSERPSRGRRRAERPTAGANGRAPPAATDAAGLTRRATLDALAILRDESPGTYRLVSLRLAASPADVTIDDERIGVLSAGGIVHVRSAPPASPSLVARLDRGGIIQLIDGTVTIEQLLARGRLEVRGHPDALLGFLSAARAIGDAATRSSALQRAFERFRDEGARRR